MSNMPSLEYADHKMLVDALIQGALNASDPQHCLATHQAEIMQTIARSERCHIVGAGKASLEMAVKLYEFTGECISGGAIAAVPERIEQLEASIRAELPFKIYPAAHPLADERNVRAAQEIANVARQAGEGDLVIALISGGGSAHLMLPAEGLALEDLQQTTDILLKAGAPIEALNAVRKHTEQLKGGGLLRLAAPARVHAFVLSDVIGDPLDVIASGPFAPDRTTFADAQQVIAGYNVNVPGAVQNHIQAGLRGERPETVKSGDPLLQLARATIIGSNRLALEGVKQAAEHYGVKVLHSEGGVQGEAKAVGKRLGTLARELLAQVNGEPVCAIVGGETTVTVKGSGMGGRNQEMALAAGLEIEGMQNVAIFTFASDGIDGPTNAAGAIVSGETCARARKARLEPPVYLENNDSHTFFATLNDLIITGPTGTNVNDLAVVLVYPN